MQLLGHDINSPLDVITIARFWWDNRRSANGTIRQLEARGITPRTLVDFGAHNSEWSKYLAARWPAMTVLSFEPHHDCHPIGKRYAIALGAEQNKLRFKAERSIESFASPDGDVEFQVFRFDAVVSRFETPAVLKVDCENMTHLALQGCGALLAKFDCVHVEMMNDEDAQYENHQAEIHHTMWEAGFRKVKLVDCAVWPRNISYSDQLFLKY